MTLPGAAAVSMRSGGLSSSYYAGRRLGRCCACGGPTGDTETLPRQIAFDRTAYYIVASCFAEQSNIQGAVAQLVERFVRIEEVAVSTTVSSTRPSAFIPPQRVFFICFR